MSKPDNWIIFSVASLIAVHLAVLVIGLITKFFFMQPPFLTWFWGFL